MGQIKLRDGLVEGKAVRACSIFDGGEQFLHVLRGLCDEDRIVGVKDLGEIDGP